MFNSYILLIGKKQQWFVVLFPMYSLTSKVELLTLSLAKVQVLYVLLNTGILCAT